VPSARSLLLTVLGEYVRPAGEPVWTATLVSALGVLGVAEKAARQALARTASDGWLTSRKHGRRARWELTQAGRQLLTDGAHRIYSFGQGETAWDGRWLVLLTSAPDAGHDHRRALRTKLTWAGFGALSGGVWVSTDPARESEANRILDELGLSGTCLSFVATSGGIGARQDLVARAWDLGAVQARYGEFIGAFAPLDPADDRARMAAQTLLVHEWRKFPFLDPQLPGELLPAGWPGREAAALFAARHKRWQPGALRCWARLASLAPGGRATG